MDATAWPEENWVRLGELVARHRRALNWDQQELARRSANSPNTISNYERGRPTKNRRLPVGLGRVEQVLGWPRGSAARILEGEDPEAVLSQLHLPGMTEAELGITNESTPAGGAPPAEWFALERHGRSGEEREEGAGSGSPVDLPPEIQEALPAVMFFGSNCVAHGAPEWLGAAYDNAVAALLKHLSEPPPKYEALPDKPAQPRTSPSPTPSGRRSLYPGAFLDTQDQVLWKMQKQHREALRKLAEAATYSQRTAEITAMGQMKGLRETVERANKDLAAIGKIPAAQTKALTDLSQQLKALTAFTRFQQQLVNPALQVGLDENEDAEHSETSDRPEGEDEGWRE